MIRSLFASVLLGPMIMAATIGPASAQSRIDDLRDKRYCEIFLAYDYAAKYNVNIFNTIGYSYCPADKLSSLNLKAIATEHAAVQAELNGPRHWVLDAINGGAISGSGETKNLGGIEMTKIATAVAPRDQASSYYKTKKIARTTI